MTHKLRLYDQLSNSDLSLLASQLGIHISARDVAETPCLAGMRRRLKRMPAISGAFTSDDVLRLYLSAVMKHWLPSSKGTST